MSILEVKRSYESKLLRISGVVGVGIGIEGIRVYVRNLATTKLDLIPATLQGYPVKVIESGDFFAYQDNIGKWRPVSGGISIGSPIWGTGTLGAMVLERATRKQLILSNSHVLAKANNNERQFGHVGDSIMQPGQSDGGGELETIAQLYKWFPLQTCHWIGDHWEGQDNIIDVAVAEPLDPTIVSTEIVGIGVINQVTDPVLGVRVMKSGRTTGLTYGIIADIDFSGIVDYGYWFMKFVRQIVVEWGESDPPFSLPGDSGSLVLDVSNNAVGLLFAGGEKNTLCNPIRSVLDGLGIDFLMQPPTTQNLETIHPIAHIEITTTPVSGAIFIDDMFVGSGYAKYIATADMTHKLSFGSLAGYITPKDQPTIVFDDNASYWFVYLPEQKTTLLIPIGLLLGGIFIYTLIKS